jgi:hypothetical protein
MSAGGCWFTVAILSYNEEWGLYLFFLQLPNPGNRLNCKRVSVICPGSVFWVLPFFISVAAKFKWVLCVIYWLCLLTEETTHQFGVGFSIKFWLKLDPMCEWHLEYNFYNFKIQWINFSCVPIGYHRSNKYSIFWNASPEQPRKNKCWVKCLPTTLKISEFVFLV